MNKETTSTFKFLSEMTEEERKFHEKNQEEEAKVDGSWCYDFNHTFIINILLRRHIHNDHNIEIYPEKNIMLQGGWMQ